jgi:hypothetical protein
MGSIHLSLVPRLIFVCWPDRPSGEENDTLTGDIAEDLPAPVFFLSYAHTTSAADGDDEADDLVVRLFTDLNRHLAQLLSSLPGQEFGFMDRTMGGGELWEKRILHAVGSCQVFVALLSTHYLTGSVWCAREWDLAARRRVTRRPGAPRLGAPHLDNTAVLPVIWAPIMTPTPAKVKVVQRFTPTGLRKPAFARRYADEGIYGLLTQDQEAYATIVWKLALHIQSMCAAQDVETWIPDNANELAETFGEVRP